MSGNGRHHARDEAEQRATSWPTHGARSSLSITAAHMLKRGTLQTWHERHVRQKDRRTHMDVDRTARSPIKLQPSLHETLWGGSDLADVAGKRILSGAKIGESWETEAGNLALNAPYAGRSLQALVDELGVELVGTQALALLGLRFPLLAKFIDAHETLSVQVHPDDAYARAHEGGTLGKTEAWYILRADPGARLTLGWNSPTSPSEVRAAIAEARLEALLHTFEVHAGDVVFVPAGTVHAIGAGIVLYELQEYSDVTYRLYDYGRLQSDGRPRELHVEPALQVLRYEPATWSTVQPVVVPGSADGATRRVLVACEYFVQEEIRLRSQLASSTAPTSCQIVTALAGACELTAEAGPPLALGLGDTVVLPALLGAYTLRSADAHDAHVLRSYVPVADDPLLTLWRSAQPLGREPL
jgi:mannose-6-phosphate isomerase